MIKLTAIQLCSKPDVGENLQAIANQINDMKSQQSAEVTDNIVVLPECCLYFGGRDSEQLELAKSSQSTNKLVSSLAEIAQRFNIYLVAGSIPVLVPNQDKFTNQCCIFSPEGELLSAYDKIHLFDVDVADSEANYRESRYTQAGQQAKVVQTPFANIGLSICFDLRFPVLFQQLSKLGANIITIPSAFTRVTGEVHWETLLKARAIENQAFVIAAAQEGVHANGRETWGHSMIISPWGDVLNCLPEGEGYVSATFELNKVKQIRQSMPLVSNLIVK